MDAVPLGLGQTFECAPVESVRCHISTLNDYPEWFENAGDMIFKADLLADQVIAHRQKYPGFLRCLRPDADHSEEVFTPHADELRQTTGDKLDAGLAGATLGDLPDKFRRQGLSGVIVNAVAQGSRAAANGLRANDLIVAVNQVEVRDLTELETRVAKRRSTQLLLTVVRGRSAYYMLVE